MGIKNTDKSLPKKDLLVNPRKSGEGGHWQRKELAAPGNDSKHGNYQTQRPVCSFSEDAVTKYH